jgi:hypothetical protein
MNELENNLNGKVKCRTKELKNPTGVGDKDYEKGLLWDRIKKNAMQDESNYDYVTMDLNDKEYEFIQQFCLPESQGKVTPTIKRRNECGFPQR